MTLGEKIKYHRLLNELSQEELGNRIGVGRAAVNKYEKGTVENIPVKTIEKLAIIFDITPQQLMGWEDIDNNLSIENRLIKGLKHLYGQGAVNLICLYPNLTVKGQERVIQYTEDLQKSFLKGKA